MGNTDVLDVEPIIEPDIQTEATAPDEDEAAAEEPQEQEASQDLPEGLTSVGYSVEDSGETTGVNTSSDGNNLDGTGTDTGSGTSLTDSSGTLSPDAAADTGTDVLLTELLQEQAELQELVLQNQEKLLVSNQRIELQLEACISILLIFMIVGLLNYIYKFFKMFF